MRKKIGRRTVLKGAAASATALAAPRLLGAQGRSKNKIIVISDVHIGDNSPWVWYQKQFHEPYLLKLLDHVIANAQSIRELIILGDFVEVWTYPPDRRPPTFSEIMAANPAIFGPNGKLSRVLTALGGRVTYVAGNHDMSITQADLDLISNPKNYKIRLNPSDVYFPLGNRDSRIACAHGHSWTLFNAADRTTKHAPIPAGHYFSRAYAYMLQKTLPRGTTVADLPDQGNPNGINLSTLPRLSKSVGPTIMDTVLNFLAETTKMPKDEKIVLASGATTSIAEAKKLYRNVWARFIENGGGGDAGKLYAGKSSYAD
ncbi:MAG: metallophosphoesterase, partial [Pseudomonadota bacterium]